jgi:hypothetical protein
LQNHGNDASTSHSATLQDAFVMQIPESTIATAYDTPVLASDPVLFDQSHLLSDWQLPDPSSLVPIPVLSTIPPFAPPPSTISALCVVDLTS